MGISELVTRRGFEPRTHCLKGSHLKSRRSIAAQGLHAFENLEFATYFASGYTTGKYRATKQLTSWIQSTINYCYFAAVISSIYESIDRRQL